MHCTKDHAAQCRLALKVGHPRHNGVCMCLVDLPFERCHLRKAEQRADSVPLQYPSVKACRREEALLRKLLVAEGIVESGASCAGCVFVVPVSWGDAPSQTRAAHLQIVQRRRVPSTRASGGHSFVASCRTDGDADCYRSRGGADRVPPSARQHHRIPRYQHNFDPRRCVFGAKGKGAEVVQHPGPTGFRSFIKDVRGAPRQRSCRRVHEHFFCTSELNQR